MRTHKEKKEDQWTRKVKTRARQQQLNTQLSIIEKKIQKDKEPLPRETKTRDKQIEDTTRKSKAWKVWRSLPNPELDKSPEFDNKLKPPSKLDENEQLLIENIARIKQDKQTNQITSSQANKKQEQNTNDVQKVWSQDTNTI